MFRLSRRLITTYRTCYASDKSLLAELRKKTGYTIKHCKLALELHHNDMGKAEEWLQQQARAYGWSKATKLEGRKTTQGLVGIGVEGNNAAIVEVNCETDFVARNDVFKNMVTNITKSCLAFTESEGQPTGSLTGFELTPEKLNSLISPNGKPLADEVALAIGTVGENMAMRRGLCLKSGEGVQLCGYVHPSNPDSSSIILGKFGALLAYRQIAQRDIDLKLFAKNLCQHIVGMAPQEIGSVEEDEKCDNPDDEKCLIFQEYLIDNTWVVQDLLDNNGVEVIGFKRFECGEDIEGKSSKPVMVNVSQ